MVVVTKPSANSGAAGAAGDAGSVPGWEDPLEEEMATHSSMNFRLLGASCFVLVEGGVLSASQV